MPRVDAEADVLHGLDAAEVASTDPVTSSSAICPSSLAELAPPASAPGPCGMKIMQSIRIAPKATVSQPSNVASACGSAVSSTAPTSEPIDRGHAADHHHGDQFDRMEEVGQVGRDEADVMRGDAAHQAGKDGRHHEDRHLVAHHIDADDLRGHFRAVQRAQRAAERRIDQVERGPDADRQQQRAPPSTSACRWSARNPTGPSAAPACRPGRRSRSPRCAGRC